MIIYIQSLYASTLSSSEPVDKFYHYMSTELVDQLCYSLLNQWTFFITVYWTSWSSLPPCNEPVEQLCHPLLTKGNNFTTVYWTSGLTLLPSTDPQDQLCYPLLNQWINFAIPLPKQVYQLYCPILSQWLNFTFVCWSSRSTPCDHLHTWQEFQLKISWIICKHGPILIKCFNSGSGGSLPYSKTGGLKL